MAGGLGVPGPLLADELTLDAVGDVVAFLASPRAIAINGESIGAGGGVPRSIHY